MTEVQGKPTITPEMVDRFARYYADNPAWGQLHVVLDDGNFQDCTVDDCLHFADPSDTEGVELLRILRTLTRSQRARLGTKAQRLVWST